MKAVTIFPGTHDVKLIDAAEPRLASPTGVRLRVLGVGINGTGRLPIDAYAGQLLDAPVEAIKNVIAVS